MLVAAASIPNTLQKTLMPRKTVDQGAITGATMAINYLIISTLRNFIEDMADSVAGTSNSKDKDYSSHNRQREFALVLDFMILAGGMYAQKRYAQKDNESTATAVIRTGATWMKYAAIAGISISILDTLIAGGASKKDKKMGIHRAPLGAIGGAIFASAMEYRRRSSLKNETKSQDSETNVAEAIAMGFGVLAALGAANVAEDAAAGAFSKQVNKILPGSEDFFWSLGHATALTGTALGIVSIMRRVYKRIEDIATHIEPAYLKPPVVSTLSGGPNSFVKWQTLSVQGRRFVSDVTTPAQIIDAMGEGRTKEPIRLYVGLDTAPTEEKRLNLLLKELERTKAYERETILLVSPTGTGYVNYVAVEAAEIMARGNIATAALQYSKRPSPMSLDRVSEGRLQFRMLIKAVSSRIAALPAKKRPKLMVFGESLGAWTSQDAFINQGTDGLNYAGIDRALWIGTPFGSKWKDQVLGEARPDVDNKIVGKFDNINQFMQQSPAERDRLQFVMLTHNNDPVSLFNLSLLIREPDWLKDPKKRPPTVSHSQYYTSPGTFLLTLIDMGNAMNVVPGKFEANGHDYRADLAEFVAQVYGFKVNRLQMRKIEKILRQNEVSRASKIENSKPKGK